MACSVGLEVHDLTAPAGNSGGFYHQGRTQEFVPSMAADVHHPTEL